VDPFHSSCEHSHAQCCEGGEPSYADTEVQIDLEPSHGVGKSGERYTRNNPPDIIIGVCEQCQLNLSGRMLA